MKTRHFGIGIVLFIFTLIFLEIPDYPKAGKMASICILMAYWWFTEAIHFAITALLPLILFPILGIESTKNIATEYMDSIIFLFIGGFFFAFAIQKWNLHHRFALTLLTLSGKTLHSALLAVLIASFFISMWISNTATVLLLLPAVLAIYQKIQNVEANQEKNYPISSAFLIGLSYASTIGGMVTLVGTPTNMIFFKEFTQHYPHAEMNFLTWFLWCSPISFLLLFFLYLFLKFNFLPHQKITFNTEVFRSELQTLGKWKKEEKIVAFLFLITVFLWFTRADINLGSWSWKGWASMFFNKDWINDSTVILATSLLLFFIPDKQNKSQILTWQDVKELPLDIILLFGGGFALARGFEISGLSEWIASQINFFVSLPLWAFLLLMTLLITIISEFASNVACIQLMLPIIISLQHQNALSPLTFTLPATLAASLGFMLPVATAPNTIVYGTQLIPVKNLLKIGLIMDLTGILLISWWIYLFLN